MSEDPPARYDGVSLLKYFEDRIADRDKALKLAFDELQRRLEILNHAHADMQKRDSTFYSREQHEVYAQQTHDEMERLRAEIHASRYVWISGVGAMLVVLGGVWALSSNISRIDSNQKHVLDQLEAHDETMKRLGESHLPVTTPPPKR